MSDNAENLLRIVDSVWGRALCALERLEMVTDTCVKRTTLAHDLHPDRDKEKPDASAEEIELELNVQLMALKRAVEPVKDHPQPFIDDLLAWESGRGELPHSAVDDHALLLLRCLQNESFEVPQLRRGPEPAGAKPEEMGGGLQLAETMLSEAHARGSIEGGEQRFRELFPTENESSTDKDMNKDKEPENDEND